MSHELNLDYEELNFNLVTNGQIDRHNDIWTFRDASSQLKMGLELVQDYLMSTPGSRNMN